MVHIYWVLYVLYVNKTHMHITQCSAQVKHTCLPEKLLFFKKKKKRFYFKACDVGGGDAHVHKCMQRPEEGMRVPRAGVTDGCEPCGVGTETKF